MSVRDSRISIEDVWNELQRGRVYQCSLRDPQWHLDGYRRGESVYVDPRPAIVLTLLHELLHRLRPTWGERRVDTESKRLISRMSGADMARWWAAYNRIKRKTKPVEVS